MRGGGIAFFFVGRGRAALSGSLPPGSASPRSPSPLFFPSFSRRESAKWRGTLEGESGAWREFVKAEIHAMGLA